MARTSETRSLLSLATEAVVGLVRALPRSKGYVVGLLRENVAHELRGCVDELGALGDNALVVTLSPERALALGTFPEDEPKQHVEAADGKEEEGRHEGEVIDVVRQDLSSDATRELIRMGHVARVLTR